MLDLLIDFNLDYKFNVVPKYPENKSLNQKYIRFLL